jgi:hypothetical protein
MSYLCPHGDEHQVYLNFYVDFYRKSMTNGAICCLQVCNGVLHKLELEKKLPPPGFEPQSPAWQSSILTLSYCYN